MFNRQTWYPGEQVQSAVLMQQEVDDARAFAQFVADAMGSTNAVFTGLSATPGTGLEVDIGTGALYQFTEIDPTAWSSLPQDTTSWFLQGLQLSSSTLTGFTAPATSGDSIDYLIQAQIQVTDATAVNLPFTNGANPPVTVYESKSPNRQNIIAFEVLAGTAATTGSQVAPTPTSGWVPLWLVTVAYGESQIVSGNISAAANQPLFTGFVHTNPNGETPVYLSPPSAQNGNINITGTATTGPVIATTLQIGGAASVSTVDTSIANGMQIDFIRVTDVGYTGSQQTTDSMSIAGSIGYTGTHAGTDADPYPQSQLNVAMLGGKIASDYALAAGNYITVYSSAPTAASGNAAVTGYFEAASFESTTTTIPPLTVSSSLMVANLNAQYLAGFQPGNAASNVPISNGTLCTNLNAQYLGGLPSSSYQPAGSYAEMNVTNTGTFAASSTLATTGGTSGSQGVLGYLSTNGYGMNSGGALAFLQAVSTPLGLIGSKIETNSPLYVGGDTGDQPIYASDLNPSGLVRSGYACYRVTRVAGYQSSPTPTAPGGGTDYGVLPSIGGEISFPKIGANGDNPETFTYRMIVTTTTAFNRGFNVRCNDACAIWVNGVQQFSASGNSASDFVVGINFAVGTNTLDVVYSGDAQAGDDHFYLFAWVPFVGNSIASYITSLVHG